MSDSDSDESDQGVQVRVSLKLAASVQDRSLEVPTEPIAVPADVGRKGLSAVLNHLLGRKVAKESHDDDSDDDEDSDSDDDDDKLPPLSFEFIVAGTKNRLLRKGVEKEARQYGVSLEEAISITYFPAANAPEISDEKEQLPDWVSCLSYIDSKVFSACYDGTIHIMEEEDGSLQKVSSVSAATGPIKALKTLQVEDQFWVASASLDHSLHIHTYSNDNGMEAYGECIPEDVSSAICTLDFARSTSSKILASGDGNGTISIWDSDDANEDTSGSTKKQKTSSSKSKASNRVIKPRTLLESGHTQLVSGVSWGNYSSNNFSNLVSGSWDHSIRVWDVERQDCLLTLNGARVVSCLDTSYQSEGVVATGHPDCTIRLWDVRVNHSNQSTAIADTTFRPSHKAWVSAVQWSQSNAYQLASTSHDGTVKLWDIRSSNPLYTVRAFPKEEKSLCLAWNSSVDSGKQQLFAGGSDCIVKQLHL